MLHEIPCLIKFPSFILQKLQTKEKIVEEKKDACSGCSARMKFTEFLLLSLAVLSVASDVSYFMGNVFEIVSSGGAALHKSATVLPGNLPYLSQTTAG